jgi:hypothetical protein
MNHRTLLLLVATLLVIVLCHTTYVTAITSKLLDPLAPFTAKLYNIQAVNDIQAGECKKSGIDAVVASYNELLQSLSIDVQAAIKDGKTEFKTLASMDNFFTKLTSDMTPCTNLFATFAKGVESVDVTIPNTKRCVSASDSSEFKKDPCCSQEAADQKCCAPRSVTITANRITSWANQTIYNQCRHPEQVKSVVSNFYRRYKDNMHQCATSVYNQQMMFAESVAKISECYSQVFESPKGCLTDADCYEGASCDSNSNKCSGVTLEDTTPLVQCIKENVASDVFEGFKYVLGAQDKSVKEIAQLFMDFVSSERCLDGFLPFVPKPSLTDQTSCLAPKKCNDNKDTCASGSFCGVLQATNGIYLVDASLLLSTESTCTKHGLCVGASGDDKYKLTKAECESKYFCTDPDCGDDCTKAKCESLGKCLGNPVDRNFCLLPFSYSSNGRVCAFGSAKVANGCISTSITVEGLCTIAKGKWFKAPASKEECEAFQICANTNSISFQSQSDCTDCGGKSVSIFKWAPAKYVKRRFLTATQWAAREQKSINVWKRTLDLEKLLPAFTKFALAQQYPIFKSYISCIINPSLTTLKMLACDCDSTVASTTQCFSEDALKSTAASIRVLGSVNIDQEFSTPEISISITANAKRKTTINIDITKTELIVDVTVSKSRSILADASSEVPVTQGSKTVGQVVGNGFAIQGASDVAATLCIQRDPTMTVSNTEYRNPAFTVKDVNGNYAIVSSVVIDGEKSGDSSSQICGRISDTRTYYPAMVNDDVAPPVVSSAFTVRPSVLSFYILIACIMYLLF